MKTNSIFFKIRLAFAISVLLIFSVFMLAYMMEDHHQDAELHQRTIQAARMLRHMHEDDDTNADVLKARIKDLEFALISDEEAKNVTSNGNIIKTLDRTGPLLIVKYDLNNKIYLSIEGKERLDVIEDKKAQSQFKLLLLLAFLAVLSVLALFYRSILNNLKPLKDLKTRVELFAKDGELHPLNQRLCDEIESVSNAFDKTATHLNNISKARSLFLRNIAHELKTPLSKGRFLIEMLQDENLKERFENLFIRFEVIIGELLSVERLTSGGLVLNKKEYSLADLLDEAIDIAFLDEEHVHISDMQAVVNVDFKLFAIALKNLLDNGVKFAEDQIVKVDFDGRFLTFSNIGSPMPKQFELLGEAFVKGDESSDGLGLGLYIIRQILALHGVNISYGYKDERHHFILDLNSIMTK